MFKGVVKEDSSFSADVTVLANVPAKEGVYMSPVGIYMSATLHLPQG